MSEKTARFITFIFQPLLMPTFGVLFLLYFDDVYYLQTNAIQKLYILGLIFILTFFLPALAAVMLKRFGYIKTLMMETREERKLPILITAFIYTVTFFLVGGLSGLDKIRVFILATTLAIIVTGFITNYYKISIHMTGCGGLVGWMVYIGLYSQFTVWWMVVLAVIISGLVGVSRLKLKAHTPLQVYTGFLFGLSMVFVVGILL